MGIQVSFDCDRCGEKIRQDFTGYADLDYAVEEIKSLINEKEEWLGLLLCQSCKEQRKEVRRKVIDYRVSMFKEFYKDIKHKSSIKDPSAEPNE
jgi:hypothetical protein